MTADELAAALYAEQGFLLITSASPRSIGDILYGSSLRHCGALHSALTVPIRVVAESDKAAFRRQAELAERILPGANGPSEWPHYYRVESD